MCASHTVRFVREDLEIEVDEDTYILEAAERAGLDIPYSCRIGTCSVCVARVDGDVDQSEGSILMPDEKEAGYTLLCIARPLGDCEVYTDDVP